MIFTWGSTYCLMTVLVGPIAADTGWSLGAVNNAVRQLGGVIGTAIAVVVIGQPDTPLAGFETAFVWISALSVLTSLVSLGLPSRSGIPMQVPASKRPKSRVGA